MNWTEAEWLSCADPADLLPPLQGQVSDRKLRLLACACARRLWSLLPAEQGRAAIAVAERFADDQATPEERQEAERGIGELIGGAAVKSGPAYAASWAAYWAADRVALDAARFQWADEDVTPVVDLAAQADLVRDVCGNQFWSGAVKPGWRTWDGGLVVRLAQAIYQERRFEDLPVLADALEEAGCDNADLLDHCRGPGPHVRGCWVLDVLLEKT
jgi:hypothetical protein